MFDLTFSPNSGASQFMLGMARASVREILRAPPRIIRGQPKYDKYPERGLLFGFDTEDALNFIEVFDPSDAKIGGMSLLTSPMDAVLRLLAGDGEYLDMFGTYAFLDKGIAITDSAGGDRSAALFSEGFYDSVIASLGEDAKTRRV